MRTMKIFIIKNLIVLLGVPMIIPFFIRPAFAQQVSLEVYPPILQINTDAPASVKAPFTIVNSSDAPIDLDIVLKPFTSSEKGNGEVSFLPDGQQMPGADPDIFSKMQIYDGSSVITKLTLAPQQQKNLLLHIGIPSDEPPSDYYFTILFLSHGQNLANETTASTTAGIGINVLLSIGPKGNTTGLLNEFSTPWFTTHGPIAFTTSVQNTSNFFIVPKGDIVVKNMFGQAVGHIQLLPVNILANTNRFLPDNKSGSLEKAIWPETFVFGLYSATLTVALSSTGPLFTKTIYFVAFPISFFIILILLCLIGAAIFYHIKRKIRENKKI